MASILEPHLADIRQAAKIPGATTISIGKQFSVDPSTVQRFLRRHNITLKALKLDLTEPVDQVEVLTAEITELRSRLNKGRARDVQFERIMHSLESGVRTAPVTVTPPQAQDLEAEHTQALIFSDLHGGEVVKSEEVNGLNEYSWEIAVERVHRIAKSFLSFQAARPYPINKLQIWTLGDMNSGDKHMELAQTNEFPVAEQSIKVGYLIGAFVLALAAHVPQIEVIGIDGNHGRIPVKPASKQIFNNWDWVSYETARLYTREHGSVTWTIPKSGQHLTQIAGRNVLLFHGDGIRSTMPGVPWGGVVRRTNELSKQYADQGIHIHHFALGHFHNSNVLQGGKIFVNGSIKGIDDYSIKQFGGGEQPTQLLATFDERKERLTDVSYITP